MSLVELLQVLCDLISEMSHVIEDLAMKLEQTNSLTDAESAALQSLKDRADSAFDYFNNP